MGENTIHTIIAQYDDRCFEKFGVEEEDIVALISSDPGLYQPFYFDMFFNFLVKVLFRIPSSKGYRKGYRTNFRGLRSEALIKAIGLNRILEFDKLEE